MFGLKKSSKKDKYQTFIKKGDIVTFGSYRDTALEWIVIEVKGEELLLLSLYVLMQRCFSMENYLFKGQYDTKNLTDWLDSDFITECFGNEAAQLIPVKREDERNRRVFLLTEEEALAYFPEKQERVGYLNGLRHRRSYEKPCWWWTSTKGKLKNTLHFVDKDGSFGTERFQDNQKGGVRPAIRLSVSRAEQSVMSPADSLAAYKAALLQKAEDEKAEAARQEEAVRQKEQETVLARQKKKEDYENRYSPKEHYELGMRLLEMAEALEDESEKGAAAFALTSFKMSQKEGYMPACEKLVWMYENGVGCVKNDTIADAYRKLLS